MAVFQMWNDKFSDKNYVIQERGGVSKRYPKMTRGWSKLPKKDYIIFERSLMVYKSPLSFCCIGKCYCSSLFALLLYRFNFLFDTLSTLLSYFKYCKQIFHVCISTVIKTSWVNLLYLFWFQAKWTTKQFLTVLNRVTVEFGYTNICPRLKIYGCCVNKDTAFFLTIVIIKDTSAWQSHSKTNIATTHISKAYQPQKLQNKHVLMMSENYFLIKLTPFSIFLYVVSAFELTFFT